MKIKHWQDSVNVVLGAWLVASPWLLGYQAQSNLKWNSVILGLLIAAVALYAMVQVFAWEEWVGMLFGAWLIVSPWVLGFSAVTAAMLNAVIVGAAVAALALWALATDKDIGGWWSPAH